MSFRPLTFALLLVACSDPPPEPPPRPLPPPPRPDLIGPRAVATSSSFDLVPYDDGALLAWGGPSSDPRVQALALSPLGEPRGEAVTIAPALAIELALAADGARAGVAWVTQDDARTLGLVTQGAFSSGGVGAFGAPVVLGAADSILTPGRGRLALSNGEDGAFFVSHRMPPAPCTSGYPACTLLGRRRLDTPGGGGRGDEPLEVPEPCEPFMAGSVRSIGTWYSAICHQTDGAPVTTVYAIRPVLSLAATSELLPGCTPRALTPMPTGAALTGDCPDGIGVAWQDELGRLLGQVRAATMEATCREGRPVLAAHDASTRLEVPLTGSLGRIEGLLPREMCTDGCRAVWTGSAILVARPLGGDVGVSRFQCEGDQLLRTDP